MIQVMLRGGLGNQMFEYALGLALAKKHTTGLLVDTTYLNDRFPRKNFTFRHYELDIFKVDPKITALSRFSKKMPIPGAWLGLDFGLIAVRDRLGMRALVREKDGLRADLSVLDAGDDVCLWGFWQSEKYFEDAKDEVRQAFRFRAELSSEAAALAEKIRATQSVSLSVRRGDYLRAGNAKIYGDTDTAYYDAAVKYIASRVPSPHFFIFSDDIAWCREHIKPLFPTTYVPDELRNPEWRYVLELSSLCKHQIIANSTFWWWAAWLNQNPDKIVIAPKQWRVGVPAGNDDATPPGWVRI